MHRPSAWKVRINCRAGQHSWRTNCDKSSECVQTGEPDREPCRASSLLDLLVRVRVDVEFLSPLRSAHDEHTSIRSANALLATPLLFCGRDYRWTTEYDRLHVTSGTGKSDRNSMLVLKRIATGEGGGVEELGWRR